MFKLIHRLICHLRGHKPTETIQVGSYEITYCPRCKRILTKEKVRRTLKEIMRDEYFRGGNQIW